MVGDALVIGARVASDLMDWQSGLVAL